MLVVVQHPVLDARALLGGETYRIRAPSWPRPVRVFGSQSGEHSRNDFVRGLGPVRRRNNPSAWINEGFYIDARSGICVVSAPRSLGMDIPLVRPVFRRFYHDGTAGRLEIGFAYDHGSAPDMLRPDIVKAALLAEAWPRGSQHEAGPLVHFGPIFARQFLGATTRSSHSAVPSWWVIAGDPAVIVEQRNPSLAKVERFHLWHTVAGSQVSVWTIGVPQFGQRDDLRRIRIYLSHLNSDLAVLELVLSLCASGRLDTGEASLRDYLDDTCGRLIRKQRYGFDQHGYLAEMLETMHDSYMERISALHEISRQIESKGLSRKVQAAASLLESLSGIQVGKAEIILGDSNRTQINAKNVTGVGIGNAHVEASRTTQISAETDEDLPGLIEKISSLIAELRGHLPDEDADAAEDIVNSLRLETAKDEPDRQGVKRRIDRLLAIAMRAGAAGTALAGAVTAIRTAIGV
jgi:hypothetical protein